MSNQENENDTQEKLHMVQHYSLGFDLSESKTFETHIRIDTEFKARNRKLTACEYEKLEASIIEEGVRDPLVLWNGILIDGHNRFEIAQRHGLEYKTVENTTLASREEVRTWIIRNQLGRRNNTPNETSYLIGKLYESMKKSHGGDRGNQYTEPSTQDGNLAKTAEKVGKEHGVSKNTVIRDAEFSEAIDRVGEKIGQEAKVAILSGEAKVAKKDIETLLEIAEESPESIDPIIKGEKTVAQVTKEIKQDKLKEKKREYVTSLNVYQPVIEQCDDIEWLVKQEKCDLLITDPPYMTDIENIEEFALNWLPIALDKVKDTKCKTLLEKNSLWIFWIRGCLSF